MREVVDVLERAGEERRNRFARAYIPQAPAPPEAPLALSLSELLAAVDRVLRVARIRRFTTSIPRAHRRTRRDHDHSRAARHPRARPLDGPRRPYGAEPWQVLSTLLGLLEMAKLGECRVAQPQPIRQRGDHA